MRERAKEAVGQGCSIENDCKKGPSTQTRACRGFPRPNDGAGRWEQRAELLLFTHDGATQQQCRSAKRAAIPRAGSAGWRPRVSHSRHIKRGRGATPFSSASLFTTIGEPSFREVADLALQGSDLVLAENRSIEPGIERGSPATRRAIEDGEAESRFSPIMHGNGITYP